MLHIESSEFIGEGSHRACYGHPENKNLCIKIGAIDSKESQRERKCYSLLQKRNISWEYLSRFYGFVDTNLGRGEVFDLVRDHDGNISKSLEYYLDSKEKSESFCIELANAIGLLKENTYQQAILVRSILPENLLYKKTSNENGRLVIIDNIGNTDLIPICDYSKFFARRKIMRKWARFESAMLRKYGQDNVLRGMIAALSS